MRLHQRNQLDYPATLEATWQNSVQTGDQILLIEEGFLRTIQQTSVLQTLINAKQAELYYLKSDATAYGLSPKLGIALPDEDWVELTFSAASTFSW